ncbi:hypothetical protein HDU78_006878 [Chytriomyces hyalinus]|nr:hypothetical protein HDU78_006878 [Chytriomyces hyalinus]
MDFVFCHPPADAPEVTRDEAIEKLATFYDIKDVDAALNEVASVSGQRPVWSKFKTKNKFGFLYGILTHSPDESMRGDYASKLYWTLGTPSLPAPGTTEEESCLNLLYNRFIHPFKQHSKGSSHSTPHESHPSTPGGSSTALASNALQPGQGNFRSALLKRDKACLFCWDTEGLDAAHLIAQKNGVPMTHVIEDILVQRAGLDSIYRVQNGVLLCPSCHRRFDQLRRYIDVVDGRLLAEVVNLTSDPRNQEYVDAVGRIEYGRLGKIRTNAAFAGRTCLDAKNKLPVYFEDDDVTIHPNHIALAFHKAACLIWKMAGAADDAEDDFMDGPGSVDSVLARVSDKLRSLEAENEGSFVTLGGLDEVQ